MDRNRLLTLGAAIIFALASMSCAARSSYRANQQEVRMLEFNLRESLANGNMDVLDYYLADDYTSTNSRGVIRTKAQLLDAVESGSFNREYLGLDDIRIRIRGDMAVLTARASVRRRERGQDTSGEFRQIRIYVREEGRWQAVLMQTTRIVP